MTSSKTRYCPEGGNLLKNEILPGGTEILWGRGGANPHMESRLTYFFSLTDFLESATQNPRFRPDIFFENEQFAMKMTRFQGGFSFQRTTFRWATDDAILSSVALTSGIGNARATTSRTNPGIREISNSENKNVLGIAQKKRSECRS